jgi:HSP20 family molecular chaperone IbpA
MVLPGRRCGTISQARRSLRCSKDRAKLSGEERAMATLLPFGFLGGADPFRELRRLQNEMDRVMGSLSTAGGLPAAGAFPAVNVYAGQEGIAVVAELPGIEKDDLEIHA